MSTSGLSAQHASAILGLGAMSGPRCESSSIRADGDRECGAPSVIRMSPGGAYPTPGIDQSITCPVASVTMSKSFSEHLCAAFIVTT